MESLSESEQSDDLQEEILQQKESPTQINLQCGASLIKTQLGYIQFGFPPGVLHELLTLDNIPVPNYIILPTIRFHKKHAINIADFQQQSLYNYLNGVKTYIICGSFAAENIKKVFNENFPQWNDDYIDRMVDFYNSIDKNPIPEFPKERTFFINYLDQLTQDIPFEQMIQFHFIDRAGHKNTVVKANRSGEFEIYTNEHLMGEFQDKIDINYIKDIQWDDILKQTFDIDQLIEQGKQNKGLMQKNLVFQETEKPFAVTFLPRIDGLDAMENSVGFIIWINGRGVLIDPPPFTHHILTKLHISAALIEWIIITQCDSRNDMGAFQMLFQDSSLQLITTRQIYQGFLRKYSALSSIPKDFLEKILKFRPVCIGAPLVIKQCRFKFFYTYGLVPSIGFEALMEKQTLYFAGDTMLNQDLLEQSLEQKVISQDRYDFINQRKWKQAQLLIIYVGKYPWETSLETLMEFKEMTPQMKKITYLFTRHDDYYKEIEKCGFQTMKQELIEQTIDLNSTTTNKFKSSDFENQKKKELSKKVDLLSSIEIFENISIKNFRDLLQCSKEENFLPGEFIIKQGTIGTKFYFVMSGVVCIFNNNRSFCPVGSYFGETALKIQAETVKRGANVIACSNVQLLSLEKQDFWFTFGEEKDDAAPIVQKLLSMYTSRKTNAVNLFKKNSQFKDLTDQQQTEIEMILKEAKFETNKIIWSKGEDARFALLVKEGSIKFLDCPEEEKPEMGEGFFIGEIDALVNENKLTTSLISLKPTEVFIIDKIDLLHFFKKNLGVLLKINYLKYF